MAAVPVFHVSYHNKQYPVWPDRSLNQKYNLFCMFAKRRYMAIANEKRDASNIVEEASKSSKSILKCCLAWRLIEPGLAAKSESEFSKKRRRIGVLRFVFIEVRVIIQIKTKNQ